jgi:hypothetical protein
VLHGRFDNRLVHRVRLIIGDHVLQAFDPPEDRLDVGPRPSRVAEVRPRVVVERVATHPDHPVERVRAADHPPAWQVQSPIVCMFLRHRAETPVHIGVPQLVHPHRVVDRGVRLVRAGLQKQHGQPGVEQAPGHDAAGRPGADHDRIGVHQTGCSPG